MKAIIFAIVLDLLLPIYSWSNPTVTSVSFELTRELIIVKAAVNGREGLFILDTGVSEVILNNRYFNGRPTGDKFYNINSTEMDKEIEVIRFNIGGFEKKVVATVTDFTAMEKFTGLELFGVVGNSIFKNCELVLDYIFKKVTIYQLDKKGNRMSSKNIHKKPLDTLSFFTGRGLPFIAVNLNGQRLNMIVDSGASANVMDIRQIKRLNLGLRIQEDSLAGFGSKGVSVKSQKIDNLIVGNLTFPAMKTLFINLDHFNQRQRGSSQIIRADGLLGYEFLSNFRVAINFRKKEIYLWDRESVELQWTIANNLENQ
ncbi:hypothetical protein C7S20_01365 [Christiangramia fulva]|uniref:Peptidase A2 domain-containing protein n=1 Tax=Christiangramia fulva TaxID=2126553 RepID=A0A2R3Z169_9FLAO|nr:aspartyl protease family protein [Christiangramia fulva]AVR44017.1 hypothetical protein C7S20_01365 [Christiangramia fulva]